MYKIEAYLRPSALEDVQKALGERGIAGMSVTEVRGFGSPAAATARSIAVPSTALISSPKSKSRSSSRTPTTSKQSNTIVEAAKSGKVGDGKVFASPIQEAVRIRTGETGESAL